MLDLKKYLKGFAPIYVTAANGSQVWENSSQIFQNITNSTSPIQAVSGTIAAQLPWFWPFFPFAVYIYLLSLYSDSPGALKLAMIAALVLVITIFMAIGGYIVDAVINFIIFVLALHFAGLFHKSGVSG